MILHVNYFTYMFLKNPLIILTLLFSILYAYRYIKPFIFMGIILLLIGINYTIINSLFIHSYVLKAIFFTFICAVFLKDSKIIYSINKFALYFCTFLSVQALLVYLVQIAGFQLNYENWEIIKANRSVEFNILYGVKMFEGYFRATSYFTESNRFGYFLTPSLFISLYYAKRNIMYLFSTVVIALAIFITFSVASLISVCLGLLIYFRNNRNILKKLILSVFLTPFIYLIFSSNIDFFTFMFDKSGSYKLRIVGIINRVFVIIDHPFGIPEGPLVPMAGLLEGGNSTIALLFWAQYGGIQTVLLFIPLIFLWFKSIVRLVKPDDEYLLLVGIGGLCFFLQQSFYGTYYEYYFLIIMAMISALSYSIKINKKKNIKHMNSIVNYAY